MPAGRLLKLCAKPSQLAHRFHRLRLAQRFRRPHQFGRPASTRCPNRSFRVPSATGNNFEVQTIVIDRLIHGPRSAPAGLSPNAAVEVRQVLIPSRTPAPAPSAHRSDQRLRCT